VPFHYGDRVSEGRKPLRSSAGIYPQTFVVLRQTQPTFAAQFDRHRGARRVLCSKGQSSAGLLCMTGGRRPINGSRNSRGLLALSDPATPGRGGRPGVRDGAGAGAPKNKAQGAAGAAAGRSIPRGPLRLAASAPLMPRGPSANDSGPHALQDRARQDLDNAKASAAGWARKLQHGPCAVMSKSRPILDASDLEARS
jgi:hypothetical protein